MKSRGILILFALFAAGLAGAQSQTNSTSASATIIKVQEPKLHWLAPVTTTKTNNNLKSVEGLDSRAWTTVAGWHPGGSAFPAAETHRSKLCLFWVDFEPSQITR